MPWAFAGHLIEANGKNTCPKPSRNHGNKAQNLVQPPEQTHWLLPSTTRQGAAASGHTILRPPRKKRKEAKMEECWIEGILKEIISREAIFMVSNKIDG